MVPVTPLIVAQDLSAVGRLSMAAALPVYAAAQVPVAALPTTLLSTQTEGFGQPIKVDSQQWLRDCFAHWRRAKLSFSGAVVGYLGDEGTISALSTQLEMLALPQVVIDPVMADGGGLYPGLPMTYPEALAPLLNHATVMTPNWTELQFLTGGSASTQPTIAEVIARIDRLRMRFSNVNQVVVTGVPNQNRVLTVFDDHHRWDVAATDRIAGHYYGAGDVFTAVLTSALWHGNPLAEAVFSAVDATTTSILATRDSGIEPRFGMQLGAALTQVQQKIKPSDR
ncbi:PfkB family carbohydrate kinase [uncultured Secundilactobacillus sp.]|uniref:PfkB family carbohydrate kinase n=1 Tax=uncultured Secundilactobacillus sp. TaxID=2813935 RepID=UPI00258D4BBA|nr:PfkB family carbohydrate kinase [uncultured Secundilactobacillus sp.]